MRLTPSIARKVTDQAAVDNAKRKKYEAELNRALALERQRIQEIENQILLAASEGYTGLLLTDRPTKFDHWNDREFIIEGQTISKQTRNLTEDFLDSYTSLKESAKESMRSAIKSWLNQIDNPRLSGYKDQIYSIISARIVDAVKLAKIYQLEPEAHIANYTSTKKLNRSRLIERATRDILNFKSIIDEEDFIVSSFTSFIDVESEISDAKVFISEPSLEEDVDNDTQSIWISKQDIQLWLNKGNHLKTINSAILEFALLIIRHAEAQREKSKNHSQIARYEVDLQNFHEPFSIDWGHHIHTEKPPSVDLFHGKLISWVSSSHGQQLLNQIDQQIKSIAHTGQNSITFHIQAQNSESIMIFDQENRIPCLAAEHLKKILILRGWSVTMKTSPGDVNTINVSW